MKSICTVLPALLFLLHVANGQDFYENTAFGIKMLKPPHWISATNEELEKNLNKIKFNNEEMQEVLKSNKGIITLCTYYKYRIDSAAGLIPTVKVTIRTNPTTNFPDFKQVMQASTNKIKTVVKNFEFIDDFREIKISDNNCLTYSCRYSFTLANGEDMKVRNKYYMIPKSNYFISISFMDNEANENCGQLFDQLANSLEFIK